MKKYRQILLLAAPLLAYSGDCFACGDPCGQVNRFYYEPADLTGCYEPLPFLLSENDSQVTLKQLVDVYGPRAKESNSVSPITEGGRTSNVADPGANLAAIDETKELTALLQSIFPVLSERPTLEVAPPGSSYPQFDFIDVRQSNSIAQTHGFVDAASKNADPKELAELVRKRVSLFTHADQIVVSADDPKLISAEFQTYLFGVQQLYRLSYQAAEEAFCGLLGAANPWIREAAMYSCARAALLISQVRWDGYAETTSQVDPIALGRGVNGFKTYLEKFPKGLYAASAQGMLRRAAYLGGNWSEYQSAMGAAVTQALAEDDAESLDALAGEFDRVGWRAFEVNRSLNVHPLFDAGNVLRILRKPSADELALAALWISSSQPKLAAYPGLYEVLQGELLERQGRYAERIELPSDFKPLQVHLALDSARADAYEALGKWDEAIALRVTIAELMRTNWPTPDPKQAENVAPDAPPALPYEQLFELSDRYGAIYVAERGELALLRTLLRANRLEALLGAYRSKVPTWAIQVVVQAILPEATLAKLCADTSRPDFVVDAACVTQMRFFLYSKRYKEAAALSQLLSTRARGDFEGISETIPQLAVPKPSPMSITKLAEFWIDDASQFRKFNVPSDSDECRFLDGVIGKHGFREAASLSNSEAPIDLFEQAMNDAKKLGDREAEATALSNFLDCFQVGTWASYCQGKESRGSAEVRYPPEVRKTLFKRLKGPLGKTAAAKHQQYWY